MTLKKIFHPLYGQRYILLMVASMLLLFSAALPNDLVSGGVITSLILAFHIFSGSLLWSQATSRLALFFFYFGVVLIILEALEALQIFSVGQAVPTLYIIFFIAVSTKVYGDIYRAKEIDTKIVLAVFTGLILLGIMATFLFVIIERVAPMSFRGMDQELSDFDNLLYFSFISLLTIGYGDMVPATSLTRTLSVIVGLVGNFYTIIVTGIVIGKYLSGGRTGADHRRS